jgi:RNA-directed DNA polymerase
MRRNESVALRLAFSLLASDWKVESLEAAAEQFFGEDVDPAFVALSEVLVVRALERYPTAPLDRARELARFIASLRREIADVDDVEEVDSSKFVPSPDSPAVELSATGGGGSDGVAVLNGDGDHYNDDRDLHGDENDEDDEDDEDDDGEDCDGDGDDDEVNKDYDDVEDNEEEDEEDDRGRGTLGVLQYPNFGPFRMAVAPARMLRNRWGVPILHTVSELAEFLEVPLHDFQWFADRRGMQLRETKEQFHNYTYRWIPKRDGSFRLLEQPKPRLKHLQRAILQQIVGMIPLHEAAHGFVPGRSVISAAIPHASQRVVLRFDIQNFFGSVGAGRVFGIFRTCGYPEAVAHALTGIVTNRVPHHVIAQRRKRSETSGPSLRTPHLPQGAPTSPALANLAAIGIDRRMLGLANKYHAAYTRYADDLFISGGQQLLARSKALCALSESLVSDEGFRIHPGKTLLMTNAGQQHMLGLVVNEQPAVARSEFDNLRATLHNCIQTSPELQSRNRTVDFRSQLLGRIGWVTSTNQQRGARLMELFNQIRWNSPTS